MRAKCRRRSPISTRAASAVDQTCSKPWGKLRLVTLTERRKGPFNGLDRQIVNFGGIQMSYRHGAIAAAALSLAVLAPTGFAGAADLPVKAAKPAADVPFFFVIDDRVTYSYIFTGAQPGAYTVNPDGTVNGKTAKSVYSFTHFDAWAYGTNFLNISLFKSDHNDPASPCTNAGTIFGSPANCSGATEIYGLFRSTFGWNEIFNTKAFSVGPLHNISFEVGMDANTENRFFAAAKRDVVAGLQFQFDLPYKGYFNVAPLVYWEFSNHNAFSQCGLFPGPNIPGLTCNADGNTRFDATWAVEPTTTWIWASCRPTWISSRSAAALLGMDRRVIRTAFPSFQARAVSAPPPRSSSTANRSA